MDVSYQEENKSMTNQKTEVPKLVEPEKASVKFTKKHFLIALAVVIVLALGAGIGLLVVFIPKNNYVAVTIVNQRDDFQQTDEICITHENENMYNCTEVEINSTRVTTAKNEQNTTNLIIINQLKLSQFTKNEDGSKTYSDLTEVNSQIEQYLQTRLRLLQSSNSSDYCYNISASECGSIDQVPLVTFVTDSTTGEVTSIGIPAGVEDSLVQPLVSSIVHIGANTQNTTESTSFDANSTSNGTRRMLVSDFQNLYKIGKLAFLPKYQVTKSFSGEVVITKKISKSDNIGNEKQMAFLKQFDQQQDTTLDINSILSSSRIKTHSIIDNSITSSNPVDKNQEDQTEISSDSNLITVETKSDEELTKALNEIQSKQNVQYYSICELQDRLSNQVTQNVEINQQEENGNRFLNEETGNVDETQDSEKREEQGECDANSFSQSRKLKEVSVLGQKVAVNTEFEGKTNGKDATGYIRTCVSLNGSCVYQLQKNDFAFSGGEVPDVKAADSKYQNLFKVTILLLGYPVNVGADLTYEWGFQQQNIKTEKEIGLSQGVYASVSLTAYGEINIVWVINIRSGVNGVIFKGSLNSVVLFAYDQPTGLIQPNKYLITLDFQMQALTFDVYASYNHITLNWDRRCIGRRWWKICFYVPSFGYSGWKDIFRKSFQLAPTLNTNVLFRVKSKCYT